MSRSSYLASYRALLNGELMVGRQRASTHNGGGDFLMTSVGSFSKGFSLTDEVRLFKRDGEDWCKLYWTKMFTKMLNKEVEAYLKRNPHVAFTIEDGLFVITHDDDRAHYILSTPGAGR